MYINNINDHYSIVINNVFDTDLMQFCIYERMNFSQSLTQIFFQHRLNLQNLQVFSKYRFFQNIGFNGYFNKISATNKNIFLTSKPQILFSKQFSW